MRRVFCITAKLDVADGSNSDVGQLERHVRSTLNSRRCRTAPACPFRAKSGSDELYSIISSATADELGGERRFRQSISCLQVTFIPPNSVLHDRSRDADYRYIGEGTWERPMAKQKRSATAIAKMISERLAD